MFLVRLQLDLCLTLSDRVLIVSSFQVDTYFLCLLYVSFEDRRSCCSTSLQLNAFKKHILSLSKYIN